MNPCARMNPGVQHVQGVLWNQKNLDESLGTRAQQCSHVSQTLTFCLLAGGETAWTNLSNQSDCLRSDPQYWATNHLCVDMPGHWRRRLGPVSLGAGLYLMPGLVCISIKNLPGWFQERLNVSSKVIINSSDVVHVCRFTRCRNLNSVRLNKTSNQLSNTDVRVPLSYLSGDKRQASWTDAVWKGVLAPSSLRHFSFLPLTVSFKWGRGKALGTAGWPGLRSS